MLSEEPGQYQMPTSEEHPYLLAVHASLGHRRRTAITDTATTEYRRNHSQETPLPLYVSLKLHAETRQRLLIDRLFKHGLCVSYDRVLGVTADLANAVCAQFEADKVVCPLKL